MKQSKQDGVPSLWRILLALVGGVVMGVLLRNFGSHRMRAVLLFPGELYIRALSAIALPLMLSSLALGAMRARVFGAIWRSATLYYCCSTICASVISAVLSLLMVSCKTCGNAGYSPDVTTIVLDLGRNVVPKNLVGAFTTHQRTVKGKLKTEPGTNLIGLIGLTMLVARAASTHEKADRAVASLNEMCMRATNWLLKGLPFALVFLTAESIVRDINIGALGLFVGSVLTAAAIQIFIVYPLLVMAVACTSPCTFFSRIWSAILMVASSGSSYATIPVTLQALDVFPVKQSVSRLLVPIGATINMDGTAIYEAAAVLYVLGQQDIAVGLWVRLGIVATAAIASVGAAAGPGGGLVCLILVLETMGVDATPQMGGLAAIDWFLGRIRATTNTIGDCAGCVCVNAHCKDETDTWEPAFPSPDGEVVGQPTDAEDLSLANERA